MKSRERFWAAAHCLPVDRPPVWLMRQAGRYLPEYRALKERHDFLTLVKTPELAAEVTLQPLRRFAFDAAIVFSDILVIPEALGQGYSFREQGGIAMDYLLDSPERIDALDASGIRDKLGYVADALRRTREAIGDDQALLGFAGSPWTLACYMVEGGSAREFHGVKKLAWTDPERFEALLAKLADATADYLAMQAEAGADAVQIFDSWGAACPAIHYETWSLRWIRRIVERLEDRVPVILFAKGMGAHARALAATGARVVSLDWTVDPRIARQAFPAPLALQGNLDPSVLLTDPETTRREVRNLLEGMRGRPGHIFNLGHGVVPSTRLDCVEALVDEVRASAERAAVET